MKLQILTATALLALLTATTASAGKLVIDTSNTSNGAIAVGDTFVAAGAVDPWTGSAAGFIAGAGGRAMAGSVQVNAGAGSSCGCGKTKVTVVNESNGAVAVGNASAGSTTINL